MIEGQRGYVRLMWFPQSLLPSMLLECFLLSCLTGMCSVRCHIEWNGKTEQSTRKSLHRYTISKLDSQLRILPSPIR